MTTSVLSVNMTVYAKNMAFHLNQLIRKYTEERITVNGKTRVIRHKNEWRWTVVEQDSFEAVKAAVLSDKCVLEHPARKTNGSTTRIRQRFQKNLSHSQICDINKKKTKKTHKKRLW